MPQPPDDLEEALGLAGLRDRPAALGCLCSCHTRRFGRPTHVRADGTSTYDTLDRAPLHDDGASCPCQLTSEEREQARRRFAEYLDELRAEHELSGRAAATDRDRQRARALAHRAGLERFELLGEWVPLAFEGTWRGDHVYFRSRHGTWQLERDRDRPERWGTVVAQGAEADHDPDQGWVDGEGAGPIETAVRVAIEHLDAADRRARCRHPDARVYCPDCGIRVRQVGGV